MNGRDERRVRLVRLRAPDRERLRRGEILLEDALRTATLPGTDDGRLLLVRSLDVGPIDGARGPTSLALGIERRFRLLVGTATHAAAPGSAARPAVYFADEVEPFAVLAARIVRGEAVDAWFWPLAAPGWRADLPPGEALSALLFGALRTQAGAAGALRVIGALRAAAGLDILLAALHGADGAALLGGFGWSGPTSTAPADRAMPVPTPASADWDHTLNRWLPDWGADDARSVWLAAVALVGERASLLLDRRLGEQARALTGFVVARGAAAQMVGGALAAERSLQGWWEDGTAGRSTVVQPDDLIDGSPTAPTTHGHPHGSTEVVADNESPPRASGVRPGRENGQLQDDGFRATSSAGLFFLVPALAHLGIAAALDGTPDLIALDLPTRVLRTVGARVGLPLDDPMLAALPAAVTAEGSALVPWSAPAVRRGEVRAAAAPPVADVDMLVGAWIRALDRWCRWYARLALPAIVRRPGRVAATPTHIDVSLNLRQADVRVRRAGLDLDPGWVPWLGRVVAFHYR